MADADGDNMYEVTIKVTDSSNSDTSDTFPVTVTVTNVDELGSLSGPATASVDEGDRDTRGTYTLTEIEDGPMVTWSLDGTDMGDFMLEGTGMSRMLKFSSAPDYESPMGGADNDSNTYMVTVMAKAGGEMQMVEVTVMVDNVDELGTLDEPTRDTSVMEGDTDVATYTLTGGDGTSMVAWSLEGDDAEHFTIMDGRMLEFSSAPDYESPMGGADNDSNTYMVTVMAKAGGEEQMVDVTIMVTNMEEDGTVTLEPMRPSVGTEIMAELEDMDGPTTVAWQWAKHAATDNGSMPAEDSADWMDIATNGDMASYTPVDADAGMWLRATATYEDGYDTDNTAMAVSASVVSQLAVNGPDDVAHPENTRNVDATYMASGATGQVSWTVGGDDAGAFTISGGMLTFNTAPNFEAAADANTDNMYNVTVVATADGNMDSQDVTVTVTDADEDGMVTVMPMSAMVGTELNATLVDEDTGVTNTTWQWASAGTDIGRCNLGHLHGRRQRRGHVPDGHGHLRRRPRQPHCHQRRRNGQRGRRPPTGSPRLRHQRNPRDPNIRVVRRGERLLRWADRDL